MKNIEYDETKLHVVYDLISKKKAIKTAISDRKRRKWWKFKFGRVLDHITGMIKIYYPFWIYFYGLASKQKKSKMDAGMLIDACYHEIAVIFGIPPRGPLDAKEYLVIDPILDQKDSKDVATMKIEKAIAHQQRKAKYLGMFGVSVGSPDTYDLKDPDLVFWPFWVIRYKNEYENIRYGAVDAALNFKNFNERFSSLASGVLYSKITNKFKDLEKNTNKYI